MLFQFLKKLHLQERVVDEVKQAIRPFYSHKKITKDEYKEILRKAVPKVMLWQLQSSPREVFVVVVILPSVGSGVLSQSVTVLRLLNCQGS